MVSVHNKKFSDKIPQYDIAFYPIFEIIKSTEYESILKVLESSTLLQLSDNFTCFSVAN